MQSRSRLKKNHPPHTSFQETKSVDSTPIFSNKKQQLEKSTTLFAQYIHHLPLLVAGIFFFFWCISIFTTKQPQDIANFLLHQAYIPLLIPFFLCVTFLSGYIALNIKRGTVIGLFATLFLLFRLQEIQFSFVWVLLFVISFGICFIFSRKPTQSIAPKSRQ